ncbi:hypothetical protein L3X38_037050 [Prunus dulcis]|uniref:Uncharacterized protein n=1 Tax=Prunus dulcis TaxID=3755 RepID=A0AAD4V2Y3_PRUDU|nr:hypothetical protein L3X38_037050 [Prunus dulcis]
MREAFEQHIKLRYSDWMSALRNSVRAKSRIVHTTGSVPMKKYTKEELDRTGIEPSPIDCFKKFHVSKPKNGGEESWPSEKAKELFGKMENKMVAATEEENQVDDWDIYKEVIGGPSHGRILGLDGGYSTKDVQSASIDNIESCSDAHLEDE